jgi:hypothetical protein
VEQEDGPFDRCERLEQSRNAIESESASSACWAASGACSSVSSGSGSHSPTYVSLRTRAERRWSIESRVVTADR